MHKINLNEIPKEILDEIFESMAFDETLIEQLNKISNNPKFDDEKKALYHQYRIGVAFWREAKKRLGDDLPYLKEKH